VAVDAKGVVYIADTQNHRIRRVGTDGVIATLAGTGSAGFAGDGGPATQARLNFPQGVAVDAGGNIYISDTNNNRVRRVGTDGTIRTFAGGGDGGDGGPATAAGVNTPLGLAVDGRGNLYIAEQGADRVRKVSPEGVITSVAGSTPRGFAGDGGPATAARLNQVGAVAVDANGVIYIADAGNTRVRRVGTDGVISTVAGTGSAGFSGDGGAATQATIYTPAGVAVDAGGNLYIVTLNDARVQKVSPDGVISTVAGTGRFGFSGDGGPAAQATLAAPVGIAADAGGSLYIADVNNNRIRKIAGSGVTGGQAGGAVSLSASSLTFEATEVGKTSQRTLTITNTGNAGLSVTGITVTGTNGAEFRVSPTTATIAAGGSQALTVTFAPTSAGTKAATLNIAHNGAGSPATVALSGTASGGTTGGTGGQVGGPLPAQQGTVVASPIAGGGSDPRDGVFAWQAGFSSFLGGMAVDAAGNVYAGDRNRVRKVGIDGIVTTVAGMGEDGSEGDGGPALKARLLVPAGMAFGPDGSLYICDSNNNRIRKVDPNGVISTVAGTGANGFAGDGGLATRAALFLPVRIAFDSAGNLYIADSRNNRVRKVGKDGVITTFAGQKNVVGPVTDGMPAAQAYLDVGSVAVDATGNVYVTDGSRVYKIDTGGAIRLFAGGGTRAPSNGAQATAVQLIVTDLAVDANGAVYTGFTSAGVVKVGPDGLIAILPATGITGGYKGITLDAEGAVYTVDQGGRVIRVASTPRKRLEGSHLRAAVRSLPFDVTALNSAVQKRFLLLSAGSAALTISGITAAGENASEFSATPTQASVGSGDTVGVTVIFKPTSAGVKRAALSIAHNGQGSPYTLPLTGVGVQPPSGAVVISTVAGTGTAGFAGDGGPGAFADVNGPQGMAMGKDGSVYFADTQNHRIRKIGPDGVIITVAGTGTAGFSGDGGPATSAQVNAPTDVAVGPDGAVYIVDNRNNRIRKVGADGVISTIAGRSASFSGDGGPAAQANLRPVGIDVDSRGNIYVAGDARIRRIGTDGIINTIAGGGSSSADGVPATQARVGPSDVVVDAAGNLYLAQANAIQKVDTGGIITWIASSVSQVNTGDGGPAGQASLGTVGGIAVDAHGVIYMAADDRVRRVGLDGIITSVAGGGSALGDGGDPVKAQVRASGIAIDANGVLYVAEKFGHRVRRVGPPVEAVKGPGARLSGEALAFDVVDVGKNLQKTVTISNPGNEPLTISGVTVEGADAALFTVTPKSGTVEAGKSLEVTVTFAPSSGGEKKATLVVAHNAAGGPSRVALGGFGKAVSAEVTYTITTIAGTGGEGAFSGDGGPATSAQLSSLTDVAVDSKGNVYVADFTNNRVRRIAPDGTITTFAGGATGVPGTGNGLPATQAVLIGPSHVTVDRDGNIYIADSGSQRVARVGADGVFRTIAGGTSLVGGFAGDGGPATAARLNMPRGVAADAKGNVYFIDQLNNRVRKVSAEGAITTFAGTGTAGFSGDGGPAAQAQVRPGAGGLALDGSGNLYIADQLNNRIRKVDVNGVITTVAGGGNDTKDGIPATQARITFVSGVAVGPDGGLFITDIASIRRVGPDGFITTIAGTGRAGFSGDGGPATQAQVSRPGAVVVDGSGNLYIADSANNRVRKLTPSGGTPPGGQTPGGGTTQPPPSTGLTPRAGDGSNSLGVGDAKTNALGNVKPGQKIEVPIVFNQEVAASTGFQVKLTFDPKKLKVVSGKGDGVFASAIFPGPPQTTDNTVAYGGAFLGSNVTAKGALGTLTFEALEGFSGEVEIVLTEVSIKISGGSKEFKPGASVVISSGAVAGGGRRRRTSTGTERSDSRTSSRLQGRSGRRPRGRTRGSTWTGTGRSGSGTSSRLRATSGRRSDQ